MMRICQHLIFCCKKKGNELKVTTQFMSGNLLMFATLSLQVSFMTWQIFCFPHKEIQDLYKTYLIEKVETLHILTDTDSRGWRLIFISDPNSDLQEEKFRDVIFEVIIMTKIYKRFDTSHEFWNIFGARKEIRLLRNWKYQQPLYLNFGS